MAYETIVEPVTQAPPTEAAPSGTLAERMTTATASTPEVAAPTTAGGPVDASVVQAAGASTSAAAATEWTGVREYARSQGVELPFEDDGAALQALIRAHQQVGQRDYYADLGRRVAPQANEIAEFLRQRQAQQTAPQAPQPWDGPEYDESWLSVVERDENTGRLRSKAGYDPAIAEKVEAYGKWRNGFLMRPETVVGPLIEQRAQQLIDAKFAEYNERTVADQIVVKNAPWMFAADPQGQPVYTPQGQRQLTAEGIGYARVADALWRGGLRDVRQIDQLARAQVENVVLRQQLLANRPAAAADAASVLTAPTSVGGNLTRPSAAAPAENGSQKGQSLAQRLMVNLNRAGAPDDLSF